MSDGDRTRDNQDHNLGLYHLSYTHHNGLTGRSAQASSSLNNYHRSGSRSYPHPPFQTGSSALSMRRRGTWWREEVCQSPQSRELLSRRS